MARNKEQDKRRRNLMKQIKAQRGIERKHHFKEGGTQLDWMGGPRLVQRNKRRYRRPSPGTKYE